MKSGMFCFITGLLVTIMGVGGVEASMDNWGLANGAAVAAVGLLIMWAGTLMIRNAELDKQDLW